MRWTPENVAELTSLYPHESNAILSAYIGRPIASIGSKASRLGLRKSAAYLATLEGNNASGFGGFIEGYVPWNKGLAYSCGSHFRPGCKGRSWLPIGSERLIGNGYLQRKMTDTGNVRHDWVLVHVMVWRERNGEVPTGCVICFIDGDKSNTSYENLECITRTELMKRNTIHNMPKELVEICQLKGTLNREINKRRTT